MKGHFLKLIPVTAVVIAAVDAALKVYAINRLPQNGSRGHFIDFILHKNPGIAFDIPIPLWIIFPLTIFICIWLLGIARQYAQTRTVVSTAAIVVIIGALGNLADRLINGFTTDYILLLGVSAINLSDLLILSGIFALLWYTRDKRTR